MQKHRQLAGQTLKYTLTFVQFFFVSTNFGYIARRS